MTASPSDVAYAALLRRLNDLEEKVAALETRTDGHELVLNGKLHGRQTTQIYEEIEQVFNFMKKVDLRMTTGTVAENMPEIPRSSVSTRLEALRRSGRIKFEKKDGQLGVYYYDGGDET